MSTRNIVRQLESALTRGETFDLTSSQSLTIKPVEADTGEFHFGDGATDMDVKIFLGGTSNYALFDVGNQKLELVGVSFAPDSVSLADSKALNFGNDDDVAIQWDGTNLTILPATDDTGQIHFGDGTTDMDVRFTLGAVTDFVQFDVGDKQVTLDNVDLQLKDNDSLEFGNALGGDIAIAWNGTNLTILPAVDDTGQIKFGNGIRDIDVRFTFGVVGNYIQMDVGAKELQVVNTTIVPSLSGYIEKKITALAVNTTLSAAHFGGVITNRGAAGALIHTIPDASAAFSGAWFEYLGVADQDITFTAATADTLIAFNDAAADSIAFTTAGNKIGASAVFMCDGTNWITADVKGTATIGT